MFDIEDPTLNKEKCRTTIGQFPRSIDPRQPPTKKIPFSAISGHPFTHSIELLLPDELFQTTWDAISAKINPCEYAKVFMSLLDVIEGEFFSKYIKIGNILMISEGRHGVDNVYSLKDGLLSLELDKNSYERAGLVGKPIQSGGKKHVVTRYVVEINLRLPSMLHGKKGFDRIVWAFKNVLNSSVAWLFCDLSSTSSILGEETDAPIKKHQPQIFPCTSTTSSFRDILVPPLTPSTFVTDEGRATSAFIETCHEIQEWLALAFLDSPRIHANDTIDQYLSRYSVPDQENCTQTNLVKISWKGLIPSPWIIQLFIATLHSTTKSDSWFAFNSCALGKKAIEGKDGYMILGFPQTKLTSANEENQASKPSFVFWEYTGSPWSASS
ncbi:hypothetical protein LOZ61_000355 [Ophidiomyces ophidiicola]|nr:hypothetical protein LOZ61_000355 [Ophidiomyces ophidiicola]KAI1995723.1 hypothetical protein LOZ54_000543 [Ophidiomyces ophidiicola]KAI1997965.1 hypothetical protein LOZ51_002638 [Ophidiomyces ophidiicola]KAI2035314.1 hypothetical protein LOZ45_000299 [Ophidiomyces ophidiicola]KAI2149301.1 hypothetical protein LOZ27_000994 [Ophidiomyces ophidiicola]